VKRKKKWWAVQYDDPWCVRLPNIPPDGRAPDDTALWTSRGRALAEIIAAHGEETTTDERVVEWKGKVRPCAAMKRKPRIEEGRT
jgi:hypothetical protein